MNKSYRTTRMRKFSLLLAAMLLGGMSAQATDYVFTYTTGNTTYYLARNGTSGVQRVNSFNPTTCIWKCENSSGTASSLTNDNDNYGWLYQTVSGTKYYLTHAGSPGLTTTKNTSTGNTSANGTMWRTNGTYIYNRYRYYGTTTYYINLSSGVASATSSSNTCARFYAVTGPTNNTLQDNTTSPTISIDSYSGNTITFSHDDLGGSYVPANSYTIYTFNGAAHNWYNSQDWGTAVPTGVSVNANTLSPTYTWSLTANGGGVASIDPSTGVLTLSGAPTGNITVRLTVSNISPLDDKTVDFTLTRTNITSNVSTVTTITDPSITPPAAALEFNGNQTFTTSATATTTTTTRYAQIRLTGGGNTYYYYNSTLATSEFVDITETHPAVTFGWALSGHDGKLSLSTTSGTSTTVTHSTQATTDLTATLTVTASASGTNKTATASIKAYSPVVAPTITQTGNSVSLATTSADASIYYTTDGTAPSSSSTPFTAPFDLTESPTTVKAIAIRNGNSAVAETTLYMTLPTPIITISNTGLASIAAGDGTPAGTTIYYTTDGSTPTSSSTAYSSAVQLTNPQIIKAIAIKANYTNSEVAMDEYIKQGVSGTKVVIDDREDHNWSYYQASGNLPTGYPTTYLSSPDPRNVKITYRGGGVEGGSAVAISALDGENQNEMIYLKTLEKAVPGMTGDYPYTVISNPFSKRPKEGSNYYGFAGWQVISGGEYISEYNNNDVLPLDATIHFVGLPAGNGGNGAVVFEATWTVATVKTGASDPGSWGNSGTYETRFWVLSGNSNIGDITVPAGVTVSARYPDGTVNFTRNLTGSITAGGNNAKVEFVNMNSTGNVSAANYTFTMGRGIVNSGNGGDLQGCTRDADCIQTVKIESGTYATLHNFTYNNYSSGNSCDQLMILGCDYDRVRGDNTKMIIRGNMYVAESKQLNRATGSLYVRVYIKSGNFGSDVTVSGNNNYTGAGGTQTYYMSVSGTYNRGRRFLCMEGGRIDGIAGGMDSVTTQDAQTPAFDLRVRGTAQIDGVVYGAAEFAAGKGIRTMIFTGGTVNGWIAGGANGTRNDGGRLNGLSYIYFGGKARLDSDESEQRLNSASGGNLFGAGCGFSATAYSGQVYLGTNVVVADDAYIERAVYGGGGFGYCHSSYTSNIFILGGTVDGVSGGITNDGYTNSGQNSRQTNPRYLSTIAGGVFGGACQNKGGTVNIIMTGGLVKGGIYGGSNYKGTVTGPVTMHIDGGQVGVDADHPANIHGGGYGENTSVSGNVAVNLGVCNAASGVTVYGDVYGGSALGTVNTDGSNTTTVSLYKGIIYGGLYGGALGQTTPNNIAAAVNGAVTVNVYGGSVLCSTNDPTGEAGTGSVFGCNNINGAPASTVAVHIYNTDQPLSGYALHAVYGGGNKSAYNNTPNVTIHGCDNSIEYVYGGGNAADVKGTNVVIWGGRIGNAFGGGNGFSVSDNHTQPAQPHFNPGANITTNGTHITIHGGEIGAVFGGSNQYGTITGGIIVDASAVAETGSDPCSGKSYSLCDMEIGELYGGGNEAEITVTPTVNLDCSVNVIKLFGGAKKANFSGNINLVVDGGHYHQVFGGNNISGTITGDVTVTFNGGYADEVYGGNNEGGTITGKITVNIDSTNVTCTERFHVGDVYGGGNMASYSAPAAPNNNYPEVNIKNGTIRNNVFGGGYGSAAVVTGNPIVTVGVSSASKTALVLGNVFGGGNAAAITGNTTVHVYYNSVVKGNVFGGGNNAAVSFNTEVFLNHQARVYGNIYGGGNKGEIGGNTRVIINSSK